MKKKIRILVVDDHQVVREGLQHLLAQEADMEVVGQGFGSEEVLAQLGTLSPNTVLMDIKMPGMDGIELTRRVKQKYPSCNVIILTLYDQYLTQAMEAGAKGYLLKDIKREELTRSIRQVYRGQVVISEDIKSQAQFSNQEKQAQKAQEGANDKIEEVQMVVPPPVEANQLMRLTGRTQEALQSRVLQVIGSWQSGTIVTTILEEALPATDILERLGKISEIEAIEEGPIDKPEYQLLLKKAESIPRLKNRTRKTVFVTLRKS